MSDRPARNYTHLSNRASAHESAERKVVHRAVVDNPFRIQWPSIPINLQNAIMARVVAMLDGVSEHHLNREQQSRKRKCALSGTSSRRASKRRKDKQLGDDAMVVQLEGQGVPSENPSHLIPPATAVAAPESHSGTLPSAPSILQHLTFGINEVTKLLENVVRSNRQTLVAGPASEPSERLERLVLVCRADVNPPILIGHLPHLVAACNSLRLSSDSAESSKDVIWLVPLPTGAEHTLAEALGMRRASVVAIDSSAPDFETLRPLLESVPMINASWLTPERGEDRKSLVPTHIKLLRTTAPKDMKAAKEKRARGRAAAKAREKALLMRATIPTALELIAGSI
ncbi:hypothetical protein B0H21DRAFT_415059 [Amylocystis lapponica]|nr:hypothetical protein B0H21DRAFT_415059 [Amylocystis lapponica]